MVSQSLELLLFEHHRLFACARSSEPEWLDILDGSTKVEACFVRLREGENTDDQYEMCLRHCGELYWNYGQGKSWERRSFIPWIQKGIFLILPLAYHLIRQ